jgi:hypothetical protein
MEGFYGLPFERFERYSPYGPPEDVAEFLRPYVERRLCGIQPHHAVAGRGQPASRATAAVKRLLA